MSCCTRCSSEQTGTRLSNLKACPPGLTSTNKAPPTGGFPTSSKHSTSWGPSAQTQESMGTLNTQCGPNRLTYHGPICSEMEAQYLLNFSSNGLLHCCCHLQKLPWCVRTCLLPCSFRYIYHRIPAKAHGHVLKVGSAVMSRRSVVASRSPEWTHMKRLLADGIFC